jgi:hypothetical protein
MTDFEVRTLFEVLSSIKTKRGDKTSVMIEELRVSTSKKRPASPEKRKGWGIHKIFFMNRYSPPLFLLALS